MRKAHAFVVSLAIASCSFLSSCGGGEPVNTNSDPAIPFGAELRMQALSRASLASDASLATSVVTSEMALDWAEFKFPQLFPKAIAQALPFVVYKGIIYNARAYAGPWGVRYLGITLDGRIFGLGDFTSQNLQQFDDLAFWSAQILADLPSTIFGAYCTRTAVNILLFLEECYRDPAKTMLDYNARVSGYRLNYDITVSHVNSLNRDQMLKSAQVQVAGGIVRLLVKAKYISGGRQIINASATSLGGSFVQARSYFGNTSQVSEEREYACPDGSSAGAITIRTFNDRGVTLSSDRQALSRSMCPTLSSVDAVNDIQVSTYSFFADLPSF